MRRIRVIRSVLEQHQRNVQTTPRAGLVQRRVARIVPGVRGHLQALQTEGDHIDVAETSRFVEHTFADALVQDPAADLTIDVLLGFHLQKVDGGRATLGRNDGRAVRVDGSGFLLLANVVEAWRKEWRKINIILLLYLF